MSTGRPASSRWSASWTGHGGAGARLPVYAHGGPTGPSPGIGLVSAAVSDHTQIDELATELRAMGARLSVSSMRIDPISVPLVQALAASGAQTLTIAPEAGSQRLRNVINKTPDRGRSLDAVELAQAWTSRSSSSIS